MSYEEKLNKLERTLDNAVAAVVTPTINTESILSVPEQLFTDSMRHRRHSEVCLDHTLSQMYSSRGPTPIAGDRLDRLTPAITDTDSRYSYVPLRHTTVSSVAHSIDRNKTPVNDNYNTDTSDIIRELGLNNTETSPPRWYNPPPEKLDPSPDKRPHVESGPHAKYIPLKSKR